MISKFSKESLILQIITISFVQSEIIVPVYKNCQKEGHVIALYPNETQECLPVVQGKNWSAFIYDSKTFQKTHAKPDYLKKELICDKDNWKLLTNIKPPYRDLCKSNITSGENNIRFILLTNGEIVWRSSKCACGKCKAWRPLKINAYIDGLGCPTERGVFHSGLEFHQGLYVCESQRRAQEAEGLIYTNRIDKLYVVFLSITTFFYLMTSFVYGLLWKEQNLPGRMLHSLVLSRALMCILLTLTNLGRIYRWDRNSPLWCTIVGMLTYFFLNLSYSWIVLLNFDFWITFRSLRPPTDSKSVNTRYLIYTSFGVGIPSLISLVSIAIDLAYKNKDMDSDFVPGYGNGSCFVECAKWLYLFIIPGLYLVPAFIFSVLTFYSLWQFRRDTEHVREAKHGKGTNLGFYLFLKLFAVMSISWSIQWLHWTIGDSESSEGLRPRVTHMYIVDWIDLTGSSLLIFFMFSCKKTTLAQLQQKYPKLQYLIKSMGELKSRFPILSNAKTTWYNTPNGDHTRETTPNNNGNSSVSKSNL